MHYRRRRLRRRALIALIVLVVSGAGYYTYRAVNWVALLPTSILLEYQDRGEGRMAAELIRRYKAGRLSAEQAQRMFDDMSRPPRLDLYSTAPAGMELTAFFWPNIGMPGGILANNWEVFEDSYKVIANGRIVAEYDYGHDAYRGCDGENAGYGVPIPPLEPGEYRVTCTYDFYLIPAYPLRAVLETKPAKVLHKWTLTATGLIRVEDRPVEDFVEFVTGPILREQMAKRLQIPDPPLMSPGIIPILCDDLPVAIAVEIWGCPAGAGSYRQLGEFSETPGLSIHTWLEVDELTDAQPCTHMDLRLVPSASVAFQHRITRCFGDIIEIDHVPLPQQRGPWNPELSKQAGPMRFIPLEAAQPTSAPGSP